MQHIAIFASGTGSNARKIVEYFDGHPSIRVAVVVSNKADAPVLDMARAHGIPTVVINRQSFYGSEALLAHLVGIDLLVLAGFLWLVPEWLTAAFAQRIVNIHPALLPNYGGKGMYGMHVHQAVHAAGDPESGITIHYVNAQYDEGQIIFQARCPIAPDDTPTDIAAKVLALEHQHFAPVIEQLLTKK